MDINSVLIVEDTPETLAWLKGLCVEVYTEAEITTASDLKVANRAITDHHYDLCLVDLGLPDGSGLELIHALKRQNADTYIVVATIYDDDQSLFSALQAGANGYVLKDDERDNLLAFLKGVLQKESPISSRSLERIVRHFNDQGADATDINGLTKRETDVLCLIAKGFSIAESSEVLGISQHTVKGYVKDIYAKLGISSRAEAAAAAIKAGLVSP